MRAAGYVDMLGLDEQRWNDANALCRDILDQKEVRRAGAELAHRLLEEGALSGEEVQRIFDDAHPQ